MNVKNKLKHILNQNKIYIASYPKSGSTWFRYLLTIYLTKGKASYEYLNVHIPDEHITGRSRFFKRIIKTHSPYSQTYKKAIYIVREPKDVLVSYYFHSLKFGEFNSNIDDFCNRFIEGRFAFGKWSDHVDSWLNQCENLLVIKYEDLLDDTPYWLNESLIFLGYKKPSKEMIEMAVEKGRFEQMQSIENSKNIFKGSSMNDSLNFIRKGIKGDFVNHLSPQQIERLNYYFEEKRIFLGYL